MTMSATLRTLTLTTLGAASIACPVLADEPLPDVVRFNRDIRPILSDNCVACHGPDAKHRKGDLRLDVEADAKAKHDDVFAIKPGDLAGSEVWKRITSKEKDEVMPPPSAKKTLTPRQIALLKKWIEQGATWEGHWAFIAPAPVTVPAVSAANQAKVRNPIDAFILARLEKEGLTLSPEADRETLIRRVSFDVTGLPPTLAELDRFTADSGANWYESMVDHYLAKPAYGERMTLAWMDAARYGDSSVFHADGPRFMWPWRDWVIKAYNDNMPFDQFTVEQLAGDLIVEDKGQGPGAKGQGAESANPKSEIPNPKSSSHWLPTTTIARQIASGFNRNNGTTDEGGAIDEEYRVEYAVDRVKTTANVWMGASMECAQCHDHKYDPITQKEYYAFYAFFNVSADGGMQTRNGNAAPVVNVPDPVREAQASALQGRLAELDKNLESHKKTIEPAFTQWVTDASSKAKAGGQSPAPADMLAHFTLDEVKGNQIADAIKPDRKGAIKGKAKFEPGKVGSAFRANGNTYIDFGQHADFDRGDTFSYGGWIKPDDAGNGTILAKMDDPDAHRGWDLILSNGQVSVHIIAAWPSDAIKVTTKAQVKAKDWTHVFATYDGSAKAAGIKIYFDGKEQEWTIEQDGLKGFVKNKAPLHVGRRNPGAPFNGLIDDVRIFGRSLSSAEVGAIAGSDALTPLLLTAADTRTPQQVETLRAHYLASIDKEYPKLTSDRNKLSAEIEGLKKSTITSMVMADTKRATYLLMRGHYASPDKSAEIKPDVPLVFPRLPEGAPANRLGMAHWLVSPSHPLTARVTVNRLWAMLFNRGIVDTVMDFGGQGNWPSHPELLDWLAMDFMGEESGVRSQESGAKAAAGNPKSEIRNPKSPWDQKRAIKQMLMSATYRQSSRTLPEHRQKDPTNVLLSRGPRFRLQGDFIRDAALSVSGLLVDKMGGPSTKPYQPQSLWVEVSLTGEQFVQDKGEALFRKSMYIFWKRSSPHPGMLLFDAPTREKCVVQRPITNTPLQALYTMNDIQFVEAARVLAQRMIKEGGATPAERITFAYRMAVSRKPSAAALATLTSLYESELAKYKAAPDKAKKLIAVGESPRDDKLDPAEHAAWTIVATTILNLDATMTKY